MSPRPIPSPCGIPLIFSSVQIRLYSGPIGRYCYRSLAESNWIMFNLKLFSHAGSGRCLVILWQEQEKKLFLRTAAESTSARNVAFKWFKFSFSGLTSINTNDITLSSAKSARFLLTEQLFCVRCPCWDVLLADKQWGGFRPVAVMGWQAKSWSLNQAWPLPLSEPGLCHSCLMRGE